MKKLSIVMLLLLSSCTTRIGPGHVGIEVDMSGTQRGVQDFTLKTGRIWYNPYSTQIIEYPTYMQTAVWTKNKDEGRNQDEEITFTTKDSMIVSIDISLSYALDEKKIPDFYVKFRNDDLEMFTHGFLRNVARDCFNEIAGKFAVEQIMGDNGEFLLQARTCTQEQVEPFGVIISQFGPIGAPRPPATVIEAINLKVQAQQIALQKQNEVMQAKADADKAVAMAIGQADSNKKLTESLSPNLLEWRKLAIEEKAIEKWTGDMPKVMSGNGQMLFNIPTQ